MTFFLFQQGFWVGCGAGGMPFTSYLWLCAAFHERTDCSCPYIYGGFPFCWWWWAWATAAWSDLNVWHCWLFLSYIFCILHMFLFISCINAIIALAWLHGAPTHTPYRTRLACILFCLEKVAFFQAFCSMQISLLYYSHSNICMVFSCLPHSAPENPFRLPNYKLNSSSEKNFLQM